jgi:hypothetical protein
VEVAAIRFLDVRFDIGLHFSEIHFNFFSERFGNSRAGGSPGKVLEIG